MDHYIATREEFYRERIERLAQIAGMTVDAFVAQSDRELKRFNCLGSKTLAAIRHFYPRNPAPRRRLLDGCPGLSDIAPEERITIALSLAVSILARNAGDYDMVADLADEIGIYCAGKGAL